MKGSNPAKAHFVTLNGTSSIRYDLVSFINLNAGTENGEEMYLFSASNLDVGPRLTSIGVSTASATSKENTSMAVEIKNGAYTKSAANVNAGTKGNALYLSLTRVADEGTTGKLGFLSSLIGEGSLTTIGICLFALAAAIAFGVIKVKKTNKSDKDDTEKK